VIEAYAAHDLVALTEINSTCQTSPPPRLVVKNEALTEKEMDRYALTSTFVHSASYTNDVDGQLIFNRLTNFSNISIILPVGYEVVSVNHPHTVSIAEGHAVVVMVDVGHTDIKLVLAPSTPLNPEAPLKGGSSSVDGTYCLRAVSHFQAGVN
jgi:hypothetical protein